MGATKGYGQYCPIAVAAEVLAERWTPLVLRAFFCGATRFNEIQGSVPRMSSALLSRRLKELEFAGILERSIGQRGRGHEYRLTRSGKELFPILDGMGVWAQKWLRREITADKNLDPDVLMWEVRRTALESDYRVTERRTVRFQVDGVPVAKRFYWLVFDPEGVDMCVRDPGHEVFLWVRASLRTFVEIRLGHRALASAQANGSLQLDGDRVDVSAFHCWFRPSHFGYRELEMAR